MARRALIRGGIAAVASLALAAGLGPLVAFAPTAAADPAAGGEVVYPADKSPYPREAVPLNAGTTGFLRYEEGRGHLWTTYAGVTRQMFSDTEGPEANGAYGAGSDVVASHEWEGDSTSGQVRLRNMATNTTQVITIPDGQRYAGTYGSTVLTTYEMATAARQWHLLSLAGDGALTDRTVTGWPEGAAPATTALSGDADGVYSLHRQDGVARPVWVDLATATAHTLPVGTDADVAAVRPVPGYVVVWTKDGKVRFFGKSGAFATPDTTADLAYDADTVLLGATADRLVVGRKPAGSADDEDSAPYRISAVPVAGGEETTLLEAGRSLGMATPAGGTLVIGGASADALGVRLVTFTAAGGPAVKSLADITPTTSKLKYLSFAQGRLHSLERMPDGGYSFRTRTLSAATPLTGGPAVNRGSLGTDLTDCTPEEWCPEPYATGDGRLLIDRPYESVPLLVTDGATSAKEVRAGFESAHVLDVSGRYAVYLGTLADGSDSGPTVVDLDTGTRLARLPDSATTYGFELAGGLAWTPGTVTGTVDAIDVRTGKISRTVDLGAGCRAEAIRVTAGWLSWDCAGSTYRAGVYNLATGTGIRLDDQPPVAMLGDGYYLSYGQDDLKVYDVRGAAAVAAGTIPADVAGDEPVFAADTATGHVAFQDTAGGLHVLNAGIPASPLALLDSDVPATQAVAGGASSWRARWWLTKPAASWTLAVRNKATGVTVRTLTGGEARGLVSPAWNAKDGAGKLVGNGTYTWALTVQPADGQGAALTRTGTLKITGAAAVHRDFGGNDGIGDVVTLNSSGGLTYQHGTGTGTLSGKTTGTGWQTTIKAVPFGDLNGDRCNDVLVRLSTGALRAYRPGCGKAVTPTTGYTSLGTSGWNQYDILTSPGGTDLVARQASTGDMYLYRRSSSGTLTARVKIASNWKGYKKVVGAGDLNGDGYGDLLAQDSSNELWRYNGLSTGKFAARVKVFNDWGSSYNVIVGVGDITGDGKADIVSRDTAGNLFRNNGNGAGSFGARTRIATGWQVYKGVS